MTFDSFNAFHQPCIPIVMADGSVDTVSIGDTFRHADKIAWFGPGLTPLDRDSLMRFFLSLGALILRNTDKDDPDTSSFPERAIAKVGDEFGERFELFSSKPFLQRWDKTPEDIEKLRDPKKGFAGILNSIDQLHPHVPGASSSRWAIRRDDRDPRDPSHLVVLLITAWFQTKNGNGKDPWNGPALKGSAGTWHVNPMAVYWRDSTSLARTILANMPASWIDDNTDEPMFLNHYEEGLPSSFTATVNSSLARFTYAKTLPLLHSHDGQIEGFVLGADESIPIPLLDTDIKVSLGKVHEEDQTRLFTIKRTSKSETRTARGAFGGRLTSIEGFERWFRAENGVAEALSENIGIVREASITDKDLHSWTLSVFSESTDGKGTRSWVSWDEMPAAFGAAAGMSLQWIRDLFTFANDCRRSFYGYGRIASGDKDAPAVASGQSAFFSALMPIVADIQRDVSNDVEIPSRDYAERIFNTAVREFDISTEPLLVPSNLRCVAEARSNFRRSISIQLNKSFPRLSATERTAS